MAESQNCKRERERRKKKETKDNRVTRNGREGEREGRNGSEKKMLVEERVDKGEKKREGEGDKGARMVRRHRVTEDQPGWFSPPRAFRALCRWPDSRKDLICCSVLYISFGILSSPFLFFSFHPSPLNRCFGPTREKSSRDVGNKSACFYENGLGVCHCRTPPIYVCIRVYIYYIIHVYVCACVCVCGLHANRPPRPFLRYSRPPFFLFTPLRKI